MASCIKPHPYQVPLIHVVAESLADTGRALLIMATGTGKTITAALALKRLLTRHDRVLFLCHNEDILQHAMGEFKKVFGDEEGTFGLFSGTRKQEHARFVFATLQTMHLRKRMFKKNTFSVVVVDESHHSQAETFKSAITYFTPRYLLGMTATPDRMDRKNIREIFGEETAELGLEEAIAKKYLTPLTYKLMTVGSVAQEELQQLLKEVFEEGRRLTIKDLNRRLFVERRDDEIVKAIEDEPGSKIVFCENITHADRIAAQLSNAQAYHSKRTPEENELAFKAFARGKLQYLVTVNKFNEGVDMPDAQGVVFLRATGSPTIFFQQLGRGLRRASNKPHLTLLDFVGNAERIALVQELMKDIEEKRKGDGDVIEEDADDGPDATDGGSIGDDHVTPRGIMVLGGDGYDFSISSEGIDILKLLRRTQVEFYTYEEACEAVRKMGIRTQKEYRSRYCEDSRLPSNPFMCFRSSGWMSWAVFLGTEFYSYKEACEVVRRRGIVSKPDYASRYKEDPRLPSTPSSYYRSSGWISWRIFLGKGQFYSYKEACVAVREMGIRTQKEYQVRHGEDPRLPSTPNGYYRSSGWKDWKEFLGTASPAASVSVSSSA